MSKRNKKLKLSEAEHMLDGLHKMIRTASPESETAQSLIIWYMNNKDWTSRQWSYVRALVAKSKNPVSQPKQRKWYLYAISDGESLKIGYSSNVRSRLNEMQVGQPRKLKIEWRYYIGVNKMECASNEKKLHRYCKKYKIRGEWFDMEALEIVKKFEVKRQIENVN